MLDKFFYINLDRRKDRNDHFLNQCLNHDVPLDKVERYQAIDGLTYVFSDKEKDLFHQNVHKSEFSKKLMGNQLSHLYIMKLMIERGYDKILISQDDAIFREGFYDDLTMRLLPQIPSNAEFIFIGFHKTANMAISVPMNLDSCENDEKKMCKRSVNSEVCVLQDSINPCSLAYIITREGARKYIEHFENVGFEFATDHCMNDYLKSKNIFYGSSKIFITGNPRLGSDIFCI